MSCAPGGAHAADVVAVGYACQVDQQAHPACDAELPTPQLLPELVVVVNVLQRTQRRRCQRLLSAQTSVNDDVGNALAVRVMVLTLVRAQRSHSGTECFYGLCHGRCAEGATLEWCQGRYHACPNGTEHDWVHMSWLEAGMVETGNKCRLCQVGTGLSPPGASGGSQPNRAWAARRPV